LSIRVNNFGLHQLRNDLDLLSISVQRLYCELTSKIHV